MISIPYRVYQWFIPYRVYFTAFLLAISAALLFNTYAAFSFNGPLGIGFSFEGWKPRAERLEYEAEAAQIAARAAYKAQADRQATIATDYEKGRENASQANAGRIERVRTIYRDVAVSVDCAAPDAIRSLLTEAVADSNAAAGR